MSQFKTVGVVGAHSNPLIAKSVGLTVSFLEKLGLQVLVEQQSAKALEKPPTNSATLDDLAKVCDLVIAVGGDGNFLSVARQFSFLGTAVLGINRGQLGFLTDICPERLEAELSLILAGDYFEESRMLIEGEVLREGQVIARGNALNDIVLFPGEIAQLIEFELSIDGKFVYSQRSDGLIIATPTGSTAYALSAGGPIIEPSLNVLVLVPKLPHSLTNRPLVVDAKSEIVLRFSKFNKNNSQLSFDGQHHEVLQMSDEVVIRRQAQPLRLLHPKSYDYFSVLRKKLSWGTQLIPLSSLQG